MKKDAFAGAGAIVAALASSSCCWLPLLLVGTGISGLGIASIFERFRFVLLAASAALLAVGFYLNYRRVENCLPDGSCPPSRGTTGRLTRAFLWLSAVIVIAFALFPEFVGRVRPLFAMLDEAAASDIQLVGDEDSTAAAALAGEWVARFAVAEGETVDVVVDLGRLPSRWAGEYDVVAFGVEDYPVAVHYAPPRVSLHFAGMDADFDGTLSPTERLIHGIATTTEQEQLLVFRRVGEARFSETFGALEAAADDSTLVRTVLADGTGLRERFNEMRGQVRLVLLLSPT